MSNEFPQMGLNPVVEFQAQETGIEPEKISQFIVILEEEMSGMGERVFGRAVTLGIDPDDILKLMLSMAGTVGLPSTGTDMIEIKGE